MPSQKLNPRRLGKNMAKRDLQEPFCSKYVSKEDTQEMNASSENEYERLELRDEKPDDSWDIYVPSQKRKEKHADETKIGIFTLKFAKLLTYIFTFFLVLGCCIFSKVTLFLMTSQMLPNRTMLLNITGFGQNPMFEVNTPSLERMGWYWAVFFTLLLPEVLIVLKGITTCLFKTFEKPAGATFFWVFLFETIHAIGIGMLIFGVFPKLDVIRAGMLTNSLCVIPAIMTLLSRQQNRRFGRYTRVVDGICVLMQAGALVVLSYEESFDWMIIVSGLCVSFGWWENFVDPSTDLPIIKGLCEVQKEMKQPNVRKFSYIFIGIWKVLLYFVIMLAFLRNEKLSDLLSHFADSFDSQQVNLTQVWPAVMRTISLQPDPLFSDRMLPIYVAAIQISTSLVAYWSAKFACKVKMQDFSFSLPAILIVPFVTFLLSSGCLCRRVRLDFLTGTLPKYVFWTCPPDGHSFVEFFWHHKGAVWLVAFLSQIWVTSHIWAPDFDEVNSTERLFVLPMYNGAVIDQSLVMNRRRHRFEQKRKCEAATKTQIDEAINVELISNQISTPNSTKLMKKVYACATMWHETKDEMIQILKSIMRMDQYLWGLKYMEDSEKVNYDFETHILFDDAFCSDEEGRVVCNTYVKDLIRTTTDASSAIYPKKCKLSPPTKFFTPYGGRLVWKLPYGTEIIVHLKDKTKIRNKKRWSQVMYMYYLLGHRISSCSDPNEEYDLENRTFILALDGDIDFKPIAVTRLVEMMGDEKVGAACGRIHPTGNGLIVWYQKFEYAIGHWLQKATEHVIGCVLCSPGCFSMFRGSVLMQVMNTYANKAEKALDFVQYDQGEDRWLCTLILKQGYRIEYSAASDAYTKCPDSFSEFYTQRRRWGPSTMANIMDILLDYRLVIKRNDSVSTLYILYQLMIMLGTILGPGTIFLMVVGAMVSALRISNWVALLCNLVPISLFVIACFFTKNEIQIAFAQFLSAVYALLMMAVLVGTVIQLQEEGINSPSGIFLIALTSSFVIAALIHPYEFLCIIHGFIYFMCVPSMYLLLTVYSLINLNVISWGTREDPVANEGESALVKNEHLKNSGGPMEALAKFFRLGSMSRLCNCMLCTYQKDYDEEKAEMMNVREQVDEMHKTMKVLEEVLVPNAKKEDSLESANAITNSGTQDNEVRTQSTKKGKKAVVSFAADTSFWISDKVMKDGVEDVIPQKEENFFQKMMKKYLEPLPTNKIQEEKITLELRVLRNDVVFAFLMLNSLFILIVFLLQLNKDTLFLTWPWGGEYNITYIPLRKKVLVDKEALHMDPIGLVFVLFFGAIIIVQFFAMLLHRFGTFSEFLASTDLSCDMDVMQEFHHAPSLMETEDEDVERASDPGTSHDRPKSVLEMSTDYRNMRKVPDLKEEMDKKFQEQYELAQRGELTDRRKSRFYRRMSMQAVSDMRNPLPNTPVPSRKDFRKDSIGYQNSAYDVTEEEDDGITKESHRRMSTQVGSEMRNDLPNISKPSRNDFRKNSIGYYYQNNAKNVSEEEADGMTNL